jgi:hypothetical protein
MKKLMIVALILVPYLFGSVSFASQGGCFGTFLVGTFDMRSGYTVFQIVNPTASPLELLVAFFDDNENPLGCIREKLSHNDLVEIDVRNLKLRSKFGVVKIISHVDRIPCPGIIGFQRHYFKSGFAESNLVSIPDCFLYDELKIIMETCK